MGVLEGVDDAGGDDGAVPVLMVEVKAVQREAAETHTHIHYKSEVRSQKTKPQEIPVNSDIIPDAECIMAAARN